MQISRLITLAPIIAAGLVISACPDRRPTWSLADTAIETLELERGFERVDAIPSEWPAPGCQTVVTTVSGVTAPVDSNDAGSWRAWLHSAESTDVECVGGCADGGNCLIHYHVKYRGAETARTDCSCKPREPKPCALNVEWRLGTRSRRAIERIWCEQGLPSENQCGLIFAATGNRLDISCSG